MLKELQAPQGGTFIAPTLISVKGIADLEREIFGPVLHVARFNSGDLDRVIDAINATGYGLTFGLHTRIDDRVQHVTERIHAGNVYVNRNQIGAIVGSQPFGGEGLSGTGPKAGGPNYMARFCSGAAPGRVEPRSMPGPTGESNRLTYVPRAPLLCLGPGAEAAAKQASAVQALGGSAVVPTGTVEPDTLTTTKDIGGVLWWGDADTGRAIERALARRTGPIVPLIVGQPDVARVMGERLVCVDTTAAGGNAALLGGEG